MNPQITAHNLYRVSAAWLPAFVPTNARERNLHSGAIRGSAEHTFKLAQVMVAKIAVQCAIDYNPADPFIGVRTMDAN